MAFIVIDQSKPSSAHIHVGVDNEYNDDEVDEYCIVEEFNQICCGGCTLPVNVIGDIADIYGSDSQKNPHGYMHEFYFLEGISPKCRIKYDGKWHKENSWYEGYSWMIIYCKDCNLHWGWYFDKPGNSDDDMFFGIRKDAICLRIK